MNPTCPYCNSVSELVTGKDVYPNLPHLSEKPIYRCAPCKAWVGCHPGTTKPLGRLADAKLRRAKIRAHDAFDMLWRKSPFGWTKAKFKSRSKAYAWLADALGIAVTDCHIGMFDVDMCKRVEEVCAQVRP